MYVRVKELTTPKNKPDAGRVVLSLQLASIYLTPYSYSYSFYASRNILLVHKYYYYINSRLQE
jgi:hypothetical protein